MVNVRSPCVIRAGIDQTYTIAPRSFSSWTHASKDPSSTHQLHDLTHFSISTRLELEHFSPARFESSSICQALHLPVRCEDSPVRRRRLLQPSDDVFSNNQVYWHAVQPLHPRSEKPQSKPMVHNTRRILTRARARTASILDVARKVEPVGCTPHTHLNIYSHRRLWL